MQRHLYFGTSCDAGRDSNWPAFPDGEGVPGLRHVDVREAVQGTHPRVAAGIYLAKLKLRPRASLFWLVDAA